MRVKCLAKEHNRMSPATGPETGPLNLESSVLTKRPLCLPHYIYIVLSFGNLTLTTIGLNAAVDAMKITDPPLNEQTKVVNCFFFVHVH